MTTLIYYTLLIKTEILELQNLTGRTINKNIGLLFIRITKVCTLQRLRTRF